jgi:hypothetical protein
MEGIRESVFNAPGRKHGRLIDSAKEQMLQNLRDQCDAIEECYEFMLAYAAQGLPGDSGSTSGEKLRILLGRAVEVLAGLPGAYEAVVAQANLEPAGKHRAFLAVLDRDARDARAAADLVLAQPSISSQLIDNLNASIHVRALLTDLFLIDEIVKLHQSSTNSSMATSGQ